MLISDNHVVSIHYRLTGEDGQELDSSAGKDPLVYLHGTNNIIPGLERALTGKKAGDKVQVTVQPEDGYGLPDSELVQTLPHDAFEDIDDVQPGMTFQTKGPDGQEQLITVQAVNEEGVTVDGNHPMAGQVLHFDVSIEGVRKATPEEMSHGHAH